MTEELKRTVKTAGAVNIGLGSIVGTGIFVSIAIATDIAGNGIILAVVIAAILAAFNGLNSAQLAAAHPVSGGTYEYGNRFLNSYLGFTAGLMFLVAKSASAATAVLGCIGYLFYMAGIDPGSSFVIASGIVLLAIVTAFVSGGINRSNILNTVIVGITLLGLAVFVAGAGFERGVPSEPVREMFSGISAATVLHASALMFVAYTGYGRIATLGEEVVEPKKTIPRAIIISMIVIALLYLAVTLTAVNILGASGFGDTVNGRAAPLVIAAESLTVSAIGYIVALCAITAMLSVLINLILGLSRVMLAMARRDDLPGFLSVVNPTERSPVTAVWVTGFVIAVLVLSGSVSFTWTFSAFTVLVYYAITNLSALMMPDEFRMYPKWVSVFGLLGCLFLAFWIEIEVLLAGFGIIAAGLFWHMFSLKRRK